MSEVEADLMQKIVSLCKRRGFVFQSSEIYGGLKSLYDYGPLGVEMKRNIKNLWWRDMVHRRRDVVGIDASIIMSPRVWEASGHVAGFHDPLVDCRNCKTRFRLDHAPRDGDGKPQCPECGSHNLSEPRQFNLMFRTNLGSLEDTSHTVYLRPETAQAMFVDFSAVQQTYRLKLPFGIAQQGRSFRNEIVVEHFIYRSCEFEQMEMEFFVRPGEDEKWYEYWKNERLNWYGRYGIRPENLRLRPHEKEELAHYAKACSDVEYRFPWGFAELEGVANRTDYDLKKHSEHSGKDQRYFDPDTREHLFPYVIEPAAGVDRTFLAMLVDAYVEEEVKGEKRVVLKLHPEVAPIKAAVLPLVRKDGMPEKAQEIVNLFREAGVNAFYDEKQSIGRRYRRQDEAGTPFCLTVDGDTMKDGTVTIRFRDNMEQERISSKEALETVRKALVSGRQTALGG
ncbi:MAG TPA: glycine--tRNA ligase [Planctomycetes bacterium]|nr:glycine--tRNA ligase [Planctomycetota bacterium]